MVQITQAYAQWKSKVFLPNDDRQLKILEAWEAFLNEVPSGKFSGEMIAAFETLWESTLE